jgi:hypothetical protein
MYGIVFLLLSVPIQFDFTDQSAIEMNVGVEGPSRFIDGVPCCVRTARNGWKHVAPVIESGSASLNEDDTVSVESLVITPDPDNAVEVFRAGRLFSKETWIPPDFPNHGGYWEKKTQAGFFNFTIDEIQFSPIPVVEDKGPFAIKGGARKWVFQVNPLGEVAPDLIRIKGTYETEYRLDYQSGDFDFVFSLVEETKSRVFEITPDLVAIPNSRWFADYEGLNRIDALFEGQRVTAEVDNVRIHLVPEPLSLVTLIIAMIILLILLRKEKML